MLKIKKDKKKLPRRQKFTDFFIDANTGFSIQRNNDHHFARIKLVSQRYWYDHRAINTEGNIVWLSPGELQLGKDQGRLIFYHQWLKQRAIQRLEKIHQCRKTTTELMEFFQSSPLSFLQVAPIPINSVETKPIKENFTQIHSNTLLLNLEKKIDSNEMSVVLKNYSSSSSELQDDEAWKCFINDDKEDYANTDCMPRLK